MTQQSATFTGTHSTWTAPSDIVYGYVGAYCEAQQGATFPGGSTPNYGFTGNYVRGNVLGISAGSAITIQAANTDFPTPNPGGGGAPGHGCGISIGASQIMEAQGGAGGNLGNGSSGIGGGVNFAAPGVTNGVVVVGTVMGTATPVVATQRVTIVYFTSDAQLAPTNSRPGNTSFIDAAAGFVMVWFDNPQHDSGSQTQAAIRRQDITTSGGFQWFNPATHTWGSTELYFNLTATAYSFAAADWVNGDDYSWSVSVTEAYTGKKSPYSAPYTLHARALPTLIITSPSGTINTPTPTVSWTPSFHAGTSMTSYRGYIYSHAAAVDPGFVPGQTPDIYDTGIVASTTATSFTVPFGLLNNGQSYAVYVQINGGGPVSAWTGVPFTVTFTPPATPTFIWSAVPDPYGSPMWVAAGQVLSPTGVSAFAAEVNVSEDGGATWEQLRTQDLTPGLTTTFLPGFQPINTTIIDYESPFNVPLLYRARVWAVEFTQNIPSAWTASVPLTILSKNYYLVDPITAGPDANGSLGVCQLRRIKPQSALTSVGSASLSQTQLEAQGVFYGLGRSDVVVVSGDLYDTEFDIAALFMTDADFQTFKALRARQVPLLLKSDLFTGEQTYIKLGAAIPVTTLHAQNRPYNPMRAVSFHCYPVLEPTAPVNPNQPVPPPPAPPGIGASGAGAITFNGAGTATTSGGSAPAYGKGNYGKGTYGIGNG